MEILQPISEDTVVTAFLEAELGNSRHPDQAARIQDILPTLPPLEELLFKPEHAELRGTVLSTSRGWGKGIHLFYKFPERVNWYEASLAWEDMDDVQYILYSYWNELSDNTRKPMIAAKSIQQGKEVFGQSNEPFEKIAAIARQDAYFPPVIVAKDPDYSELTIVEGHQRMTGFALAGCIPKEQKIYLGIGKGIKDWSDWDKS